jgi:hypothetical protein
MKLSSCVTTFSFLVFTLGLLANSPTAAASGEVEATPEACGSTIEANLAAAQKSLQSNGKTTRTAVACLIEATTALNEKVHNDRIGQQASGMLSVPVRVDAPKVKQ